MALVFAILYLYVGFYCCCDLSVPLKKVLNLVSINQIMVDRTSMSYRFICFNIYIYFLTRALKGLTFEIFCFDVCVCMFGFTFAYGLILFI